MQIENINTLSFGPDICWPKDFSELKLIDDCLRCGICYEYFKTVMVTPCAHSYCSICIRKYLSFKTACPICFEEVFETSLRNNRILDRLVELFLRIRDKLIKQLKIAALLNCNEKPVPTLTPSQSNTTKKIALPTETPKNSTAKKIGLPTETPKNGKNVSTQATSSKGKLNFSLMSTPSSSVKKSQISKRLEDILGSPATSGPTCSHDVDSTPLPGSEDHDLNIPTVPTMFLKEPTSIQAKTDVPLVTCPVCLVGIPERNINTHLDNCLANADKPARSPVKNVPKRKPLAKMVWHMMAEKDLRKKLKEYGLNTQGDKKSLIARIQRYIVLYNSECDSANPRSIADLIRQVEREEKQQNPQPLQFQRVVTKKSDPKVIEEENNKYIQENKDSFKKLIEAMRQREGRNIKPLRPINRLSSDDEGEDDRKTKDREKISNNSNGPLEILVDLCSRSSSPVLDSWTTKAVENDRAAETVTPENLDQLSDDSICDIFQPDINHDSKTFKKDRSNKDCGVSLLDEGDDFEAEANELECYGEEDTKFQESARVLDEGDDFCDAEDLFNSSPSRPPAPSCIIRTHSESESDNSISILIDQNLDTELCNQVERTSENCGLEFTEKVEGTENPDNDPDFVVNTEDQEQGDSEEVLIPQRKPGTRNQRKRKESPVINEIPSPRRSRRRVHK
ncbi:E3 ubiquitin-protein ligase RAD18-like [Macrosteles quadrilineatus]|uniref:E3 ubiquitin-protein ligase RAD18-like n=1 Tax=Macrosteles quadrilineatus TaxID=74068 RepID=UPI0023E1B4B3|nr:E3 ubiquitin-protein ligase RAD18-like [Macrosteles quadrilineatus]XP_054269396.1 E3 ubiquitin-protein ligase RAD18-like [Macrosteles quadrilineatus]XP_054269397.1 E3 ubiquitin-protein ligase RAD18-like [Macrosteles quadrilineatus]XP_054269398.1 E3 ubiquitin-protein ligase RAD18-like [Macrosteles quadrilineatus]